MGQASPFKPIALVVEDDFWQREMAVTLLEENGMGVIQCESAEAAMSVLQKMGRRIALMFTDVNLAGRMNGVQLAHFAKQRFASLHVIVTSGLSLSESLPVGALFFPKPWLPLDVLREAERSRH
jgi:two-component system, cell cycle response regulator CpdR